MRIRCWLGLLALVVATPARAAEPAPLPVVAPARAGFSSAGLARGHALAQQAVADGQTAGLISLVIRNGQIADWQTWGYRDREAKKPMEKDTIVHIYSMSKVVTSVAVLLLLEEGRFTLKTPVETFIPELARRRVFVGGSVKEPRLEDAKRPITVGDLLTHTAGIPYGAKGQGPLRQLYEDAALFKTPGLKAFVQKLGTLPLDHHPGEKFTYGLNTDVLGYLVQVVVSGQPFEEFLQKRIFGPLKMRDSGFFVPAEKQTRVAKIYRTDETSKALTVAEPILTSECGSGRACWPSGGGGLFSTAGDYARFAQMLLNGGTLEGVRILARPTVAFMRENHLPATVGRIPWDSNLGFGLGVSVRMDRAQAEAPWNVGTFGWDGAASTYCRIDPKENLILLHVMQHFPMDPSNIIPRLTHTLYGAIER